MNIGFFIGHEKLVGQAHALVDSINKLSCFADSEITLVTKKNILKYFDNIEIKKMHITNEYLEFPFCDKIYAASCFEKENDGEYLWIDVDSYFFSPIVFNKSVPILLNAVDMRNIGNLYNEELDEFWSELYGFFNLELTQGKGITTITNDEIYPYFNVGMVMVNKNKRIFNTTNNAIREIVKINKIQGILNRSNIHRVFFHQAVFSCVVLDLYKNEYEPLPQGVNYPLHLFDKDKTIQNLSKIKSIRYDNYFNNNQPPKIWKENFKPYENKIKNYWYYI